MAERTTVASRIRGSLYGVAIVDALGGPVEFHRRDTFPPVESFRYNANFDLPPGTWTDDTSMTLCLAQSIVNKEGKLDVHDQVKKYVDWWERGYMSATGKCFDIGNATRNALGIWSAVAHTDVVNANELDTCQKEINKALDDTVSCGNGSLMRCSPIPLIYHRTPELANKYAAEASLPTHPHITCQEACQIYTYLITCIVDTSSLDKAGLWENFHNVSSSVKSDQLLTAFSKYHSLAAFQQTKVNDISSSGYVVHTLEAALWVFWTTESFETGALKVVNLGDDADTVGAVYGGIAGAWYGYENIPRKWLDQLEAKSMIDFVVEGVVNLVDRGGY
ncbi:hypothetical protein MMC21_005475 [Puttea exsequens]|nr:hypothetical protein [Puttea exsequens]